MKLVVYGTLKRGRGNHRFMGESKFLGKCKLDNNYKMYVEGIPYVKREKSDKGVIAELYEVDEFDLFFIDRLEGHPKCYRREPCQVTMDNGSIVDAETYIYLHNVSDLPSREEF